MNAVIDAAMARSRTTLSTLALILIAGMIAYLEIPRESEPDISLPTVYVTTALKGISPEDGERMLLRPLESEFRGLDGLDELRSTAYQGGAHVILEFDPGLDIEDILEDVHESVDRARPELPEDADDPSVHEINIGELPVIVVTLSGSVPERTLYRMARRLRDEIESLKSIIEAKVSGDRDQVVEVVIDPLSLASYNLTTASMLQVGRSNVLVSAGVLDTGNGRFPVKVPGLYESLQDLRDQPIQVSGSTVVTLDDVAEFRSTFRDPVSVARLAGEPAVGLSVVKRAGENIIDAVSAVRLIVEKARERAPEGVNIVLSQDRSDNVHRMLSDLQNNVLTAVMLVMVLVVGVLGWRSGLLVGISIPGSFLLSILALHLLGFTLNMVVMFSLILAVGILVDATIVVVEFADRKMAEGRSRLQAYGDGAKRMAWPITASTATTLAVFLPLLFWPGIVGQIMKYLPLTLIAVLSASLLMALVFIPTLGAQVGRQGTADPRTVRALAAAETGSLDDIAGPAGLYMAILRRALRRPGRILLLAVCTLVVIQALYARVGHGVVFFPDVEPEQAQVDVHARGSLSLAEKVRLVGEVERAILDLDEFRSVYSTVGQGDSRRAGWQDRIGRIKIEFKDWRERRPAHLILDDIAARTGHLAGIRIFTSINRPGPVDGKLIKLRLRGHDLDDLGRAVGVVRERFTATPGLSGIEDQWDVPGIEWRLEIDRARANEYGVNVRMLGTYVKLVSRGVKLSDFRTPDADDEIDIILRFPERYRTIRQLEQLRIRSDAGLVPISNFVRWQPVPVVGSIERVDGQRSVLVQADVVRGVLSDSKVRELRRWLESEAPLPEGVEATFGGEDEQQAEARAFLVKAFGFAVFLMAIILVTQFNNFYSAFLVLTAVIMSTIGVMIGLLATAQPFGIVMTGVGVIALAGIVVNNNIVLIDTFDRMMLRTGDAYEAVLRTGAQRLRPVLLTTVTTMFGLLPMVLQLNINLVSREVVVGAPSSQWWVSLSTAIFFGLGFASVLTLVVTPCALLFRANLADRLRARRAAPAP